MSDFGADHAFAEAASKLKARAAALRWLYLVESGKPKKDDSSTGIASEWRLGRLLEQSASGSCM
jgi:hypothetical protein